MLLADLLRLKTKYSRVRTVVSLILNEKDYEATTKAPSLGGDLLDYLSTLTDELRDIPFTSRSLREHSSRPMSNRPFDPP